LWKLKHFFGGRLRRGAGFGGKKKKATDRYLFFAISDMIKLPLKKEKRDEYYNGSGIGNDGVFHRSAGMGKRP
jgi:hypothetical protein